jgi:hypothetical protein
VPHDIVARRYTAIAEVRFGLIKRALTTLAEGLPYAPGDLDYLKLLCGLMLEAREDERIITLAKELLPEKPDGLLIHQYLALQAATAHFNRGRTEATEQLISDWRLENSLEGEILLSRCEWDSGLRDLALQRLENQIARFPRRDELYLELVRRQRERGNQAEARRFALLRQFNDPASPGPRIDLLHTYRTAGDTAAEQRELTSFLAAFSGDPAALQLLAWFAVDTVQPDLAARVHALAAARQFPLPNFNLARIQVTLAARDPAAALVLADEALRTMPGGHEVTTALIKAMRAVALFKTGDPSHGHVLLNDFLVETRLRADDVRLIARLFIAYELVPEARRVLDRACELDPLNHAALAEQLRLDVATEDEAGLARHLPAILAMGRRSRAVLEETRSRLTRPGDEALRAQVDAALAGQVPAATL